MGRATDFKRDLLKMFDGRLRVDLEQFVYYIFQKWGGPEAMAEDLRRLFLTSASKPLVQQRILMMIQQMLHACTVHRLGHPFDHTHASQDELEAIIDNAMVRHVPPEEGAAAEPAVPAASAGAGGA
jgi:hypothetical protein